MISTPVKRAILVAMATLSLAACGVSENKYAALDAQYRQSQAQNAANQQQIAALDDQVNRLQHANSLYGQQRSAVRFGVVGSIEARSRAHGAACLATGAISGA